MKGLDTIMGIRMAGSKPAFVVVEIDPPFPIHEEFDGEWATVQSSEKFDRLDLRALVDLPVFVVGDNESTVKRFCEAAMASKARESVGMVGTRVVFAKGEMAWLR